MTDQDYLTAFYDPLVRDITQTSTYPMKRPLLAHYTSIETLEKIVHYKELWLSNPLFMNDLEELRVGIRLGTRAYHSNKRLKDACGSADRYDALTNAFNNYAKQFEEDKSFDIYAICFSEHDAIHDADGLLSMWRGYGNDGNGAAIVINTAKINADAGTPLILSDVIYKTQEERLKLICSKVDEFAQLLIEVSIPTNKLHLAAYALFTRIKLFALFTKHKGFSEEKEWRAVYSKERDSHGMMVSMLGYFMGTRGLEPKLKLRLEPKSPYPGQDLSLNNIVHQIILGPSLSNPLAVKSVHRMLETLGMHDLCKRVSASSTPFRGEFCRR